MAIGAKIVNDAGGQKVKNPAPNVGPITPNFSNVRNFLGMQAQNAAASPLMNVPKNSGVKVVGSTTYSGGGSSGGSSGGTTAVSYSGGGGGGGGFDYLAQLRSLAEDAYNRSMDALKATRTTTLGKLLESYNASKDALQNQFNASKQNLTDDNAQALREAYIRKMLDARDMAQLLTAQGLTGGASETTTANLLNNYNNSRNNLNRDFARNLLSLSTNHESSLADILGKYNDKVAQAEQAYASNAAQLENNRMNMLASVLTRFGDLAGIAF